MVYRAATMEDLDLLVSRRLQFIEVDESSEEGDYIKKNCYIYFEKALEDGKCDAIFAEMDGKIVGTGIIFYYASVPSSSNPTGKNAYVTSLFVEPSLRGQGVARSIMERLIEKAGSRGYKVIMLNASDMGKPLYEKMGFTDIQGGMILRVTPELL